MLRGIDISSWQTGIDLRHVIIANGLDFVVVKATEGCAFVEDTCDYWVQTCISNDTLFGVYHFARHNEPEAEADFFIDACEGYVGHGILVLDTETGQTGEWCQRFVDRVHARTGVYPIVYMSSNGAQRGKFIETAIPRTCGLWEAFYPSASTSFDDMPEYSGPTDPWEFGAMWQFTSSGRLIGYDYDLDLDVAWMDRDGWMLYADPEHEHMSGNTEVITKPSELHTFEDDKVRVTVEVKK